MAEVNASLPEEPKHLVCNPWKSEGAHHSYESVPLTFRELLNMPYTQTKNYTMLICLLAIVLLTVPVMGDRHEATDVASVITDGSEPSLKEPESQTSSNETNSSSEPVVSTSEFSSNSTEASEDSPETSSSGKGDASKASKIKLESTEEGSTEEISEDEEDSFTLEVPQTENAILPVPTEANVVGAGTKFQEFMMKGINGENATLLITGGLFIVVFVLGASIFNTWIDNSDTDPSQLLDLGTALVTPLSIQAGKVKSTFDAGMLKAKELRLKSLDDVFDSIVALGIGDPRISSSSKRNKTIRIYNCIECERTRSRKEGVCEFTKGFLTGGFRNIQKGGIEVEETKCCGSGADYCEYSIVFGR